MTILYLIKLFLGHTTSTSFYKIKPLLELAYFDCAMSLLTPCHIATHACGEAMLLRAYCLMLEPSCRCEVVLLHTHGIKHVLTC